MTTDETVATETARSDLAWWRLPSALIVMNPGMEDLFSKAVWLVLPLQYYVLSRLSGGLKNEYVAVALVVAVSLASLFVVSLVLGLLDRKTPIESPHEAARMKEKYGGRYALSVRLWAIALIVSWMAVHLVLAVSLAVGFAIGYEQDLVDVLFCNRRWMFPQCTAQRPNLGLLTIAEYVINTTIAVVLLIAGGALFRRFSSKREDPLVPIEPNPLFVIVTVAGLLTIINNSTMVR